MGWREQGGGREVAFRRAPSTAPSRPPSPRPGGALAVALAVLLAAAAWAVPAARAAPEMPAPSYDNTFYAFVYDAPLWTESDYVASRDELLARANGPGRPT